MNKIWSEIISLVPFMACFIVLFNKPDAPAHFWYLWFALGSVHLMLFLTWCYYKYEYKQYQIKRNERLRLKRMHGFTYATTIYKGIK